MRTRVDARRDWRHAVDVAEETRNQYAFRVQRLPLLPRTRINAMAVNWPIANIRNLLDHFLTTVVSPNTQRRPLADTSKAATEGQVRIR